MRWSFCAQDAGIRHFTFTPWMTYLMDAAGQVGTEVIVVDRPNPLNGRIIEGGVTQEGYYSLIGAFSYPLRHGMTIGELALMYNGEHQVGCKLTVIPMENWARDMWYDQTGLLWTPPSPNLPVPESLLGFATTGLLQSTTVSFGGVLQRLSPCSGHHGWTGGSCPKAECPGLSGRVFLPQVFHSLFQPVRRRGLLRCCHSLL